jgi:hypothetical protein
MFLINLKLSQDYINCIDLHQVYVVKTQIQVIDLQNSGYLGKFGNKCQKTIFPTFVCWGCGVIFGKTAK